MKVFMSALLCSVLLSVPTIAADEQNTLETEEHSQAYYDQQVTESMKELTSQLQLMSGEIIKYMNAVNKAINESVPQMSEDMGKMISSMKPLAETMQKNVENFAKEINTQLDLPEDEALSFEPAPVRPELASEAIKAPEEVIVPTREDLSAEIDDELAQFTPPPPPSAPRAKIKLFPSTVE